MENQQQYGVISGLSTLLTIIGWLVVAFGAVLFLVGIVESATSGVYNQNPYNAFSTVAATIKMTTGFSAFISGILLVAIGQAIRIFIDIALNTGQIAQSNAALVGHFDRISNKGARTEQTSEARQEVKPVDEGNYYEYRWASYSDGKVFAANSKTGEQKMFQSNKEFMDFVHAQRK